MSKFARTRFLLPALALLPASAHAQTSIFGRILDSDHAPISFANVQLRVHADSSPVRATISDPQGNFLLETVSRGTYRIYVSRIGYQTLSSDVLTVRDGGRLHVPALILETEAIALEGVSVQATKALYQQRADRLIINLASSPTLSGASALQVLERSPGVVVDQVSGSISLIGKDGVRVLINGKLSYIPAEGLVQYFAGLSADNIERIELITSPPASLDAEGDAGYVNIVMKRSPDTGLSGSVSLSGGYGEGEIGNASTSLGYQRGRIGLYGSYSFLWNAQNQFISNYRRVDGTDGLTEMPSASWRHPVQRNHDARIGIEYQITDRTMLGALAAAYDNRWSMDALNRLTIEEGGTPITRIDSDNEEVNQWRHAMLGLSLQHELGSVGSLRMDVDYLRYGNDNPTVYLNTQTDVASGEVTEEHVESGKTTPLSILVARADYTRTRGGWEFETGVKGAFSRFTNETSLRGPVEDTWVSEAGFGSSTLREDVLAVYGSAAYTPGEATTLKAGVRYEFTDSNLGSEEEQGIVDRRFGSLFPSVALSHKLDDFQIDASYTRRITRPSFRDMAPFLYFFDPHTFFSGNAALQPAVTNTVKLDGSYESVLASLQYAWEDSTIAAFQSRFLPEYNLHVMFPTNFRGTKTATALFAAPVHVTSWWSTQNNAMVMWQEVDGSGSDVPVMLSSTSYRLNSTQTITLPRNFAFEASGFYQSASLMGAVTFGATWQVNAALQARLRDNARLSLRIDNVFDSFEWRWTTGAPDDPLYIDQTIDIWPRSVSVAYSMSFGGGEAAERKSASEEERERVPSP
ncbi:MAG TPA: outer membrane beta-barrel protein [Longimicrobiales bacterium]|nr:outer membrane beta-barrel protein [Longimicrobiales bacterium]